MPLPTPFLVKILTLSLLCFALAETAKADVKGIPFTPQFESASYPYARSVAGCTEWRRPRTLGSGASLGDTWGPVAFGSACVLHDQCYHTPGAGWGECNQRFLTDLRASCDRDLKREALAKGRTGAVDAQALQLCYEIANMYFAKVQEPAVAQRYELAQRMQAEYVKYVRGVIAGVYQASLGRAPTAKETDRALAMLAEDYGLADLKTALMGAKLDADDRSGAAVAVSADSGDVD